jgi:hypothetical protein
LNNFLDLTMEYDFSEVWLKLIVFCLILSSPIYSHSQELNENEKEFIQVVLNSDSDSALNDVFEINNNLTNNENN